MIGMFDSGVGGLTVLRALRDHIPSADVVYFGDTKNAPYGVRPRDELTQLTVAGVKLLKQQGATKILSACNSVSASLAVSLLDAFSIAPKELIEMVGPTVSYFKGSDANLLLVATPATIASGIYQNAFLMIGKTVPCVALPELAGLIERGASQKEIEASIRAGLSDIPDGIDGIVLACTHYPLALEAFRAVVGTDIELFDPAEPVAERVERDWWPQEVGEGKMEFLISKESAPFRKLVEELFPDGHYTLKVIE